MYTNPHIAHQLARTRQEDLRRQAIRRSKELSGGRQERSTPRLRFNSAKASIPRSALAR